MMQLFMKCLLFIQSQMSILNKKQKLESSLILSVSRSILIASYTYYLKQLNNLEHDLKIDIK